MHTFDNFRKNQNGSVAIIFALLSVVLLTSVGLAVDSWHRLVTRDHIQNAMDSAVLAGARASGNQVMRAQDVFFSTLETSAPNLSQATLIPTFTVTPTGGINGQISADIKTFILQAVNIVPSDVTVSAVADWTQNSGFEDGCIFLTDPSNTGLDMTENSSISADCTIQIETNATAIDLSGNANATFDGICANGSISANGGSLTPANAIPNCTPVLDPFGGLSAPTQANQPCSNNNDVTVGSGTTLSLVAGVHCGEVEVEGTGTLTLEAGIHAFKGGLNVEENANLTGEDVLIIFDRDIDEYDLNGNVDVAGLRSGDFQGFVLYHEDFDDNSNQINIGENSNVDLEGVIYIPNTNIRIATSLNDNVDRSIMVTDRLELSGNGSFTGRTTGASDTPLPNGDLGVGAQSLRLIR